MSACRSRELLRFAGARRQLSAAQALTCLAPQLLAGLVTEAAFDALRPLVRGMPAIWRWAMFECRLARDSPRVDFMACVADVDDDRRAVARALRASPSAPFDGALPLLAAWSSAQPPFAAAPVVWLEWDVVGGVPAPPLSSVCLDASFLRPRLERPELRLQAQLVHALLAEVMGERALAARVDAGLSRCLSALPEGTCLLHAAPLLARGLPRLRVTLGLQPEPMLRWLAAIGWPGDLRQVAAWLAIMSAPWQQVFFQVELDDRVHPHLSVETRLSSEGFPERQRWRALLEACANAALLDPARAELALRWPGESILVMDDRPLALTRSAYLKLVLNGGSASEVKAYLGCSRAS